MACELSVSVVRTVCQGSEAKADGPILDLEGLELQDWIERGHDCEVGAATMG